MKRLLMAAIVFASCGALAQQHKISVQRYEGACLSSDREGGADFRRSEGLTKRFTITSFTYSDTGETSRNFASFAVKPTPEVHY